MRPMSLINMTDLSFSVQDRHGACLTKPSKMASRVVVSKMTNAIDGVHNNLLLYSVLSVHVPSSLGKSVIVSPGKRRNEVNVDAHRTVQIATVVGERKWLGITRTRRRNNHELQGTRIEIKHFAARSRCGRWHEVNGNAAQDIDLYLCYRLGRKVRLTCVRAHDSDSP